MIFIEDKTHVKRIFTSNDIFIHFYARKRLSICIIDFIFFCNILTYIDTL